MSWVKLLTTNYNHYEIAHLLVLSVSTSDCATCICSLRDFPIGKTGGGSLVLSCTATMTMHCSAIFEYPFLRLDVLLKQQDLLA
jgi:hypothetical protein